MKNLIKYIGRQAALFTFCAIAPIAVSEAAAQIKQSNLVAVYDGRDGISETAQKQGTAAEKQLLDAEFKRRETVIMRKSKFECDETAETGVGIVGTAEGSFTKPNSPQKAFLYERCRAGRSFGIGGIVVTENGKVAAHYVYGENGLASGLLSLPDINKNGLSEIVLVSAHLNQGYGGTFIDLIEATGPNMTFLGRTAAHSDDSGAAEDDADVEITDYKISVQPSSNPVFFSDTYQQKGENGKPRLTKQSEKFSLSKDEPTIFIKVS